MITSVGRLIDDALDAIEKENPKLKGVLNKAYASLQLDAAKLGELIDLVATIPFHHASLGAKDILGHVYEYFLGQFALAEGKKGGQYYTPKAIVTLIVEMLQPFKGRVYDPAMGSGGFFVQSESFIEQHQGKLGNISVYGQESNPTTWRLVAMNMAIRGIDFNFGKEPANSFTNDKHPDLRADYVMANPPFNMKEWWDAKLESDPRWQYGTPPKNNANFAWMQHMLYHLAPKGSLALLLANGSMNSSTPEQRQQLTATAALFPDELEDSDLGPIAKGWEVSNIGNEFDVIMGQSPPGDTYNEDGEGMPFFQGRRDFRWRYPTNRVYCTAPKRLAKISDALLSVRAPVGDVNKATSGCCIGRGIAALRHKSGCDAFTYYSLQRLEQYFKNFDSEGTVFGSINQKDLKAIKTVAPISMFLRLFTEITSKFDDEIRVLEEQTYCLSSIRDSLLPKLLSGDITLDNAQSITEAVA